MRSLGRSRGGWRRCSPSLAMPLSGIFSMSSAGPPALAPSPPPSRSRDVFARSTTKPASSAAWLSATASLPFASALDLSLLAMIFLRSAASALAAAAAAASSFGATRAPRASRSSSSSSPSAVSITRAPWIVTTRFADARARFAATCTLPMLRARLRNAANDGFFETAPGAASYATDGAGSSTDGSSGRSATGSIGGSRCSQRRRVIV